MEKLSFLFLYRLSFFVLSSTSSNGPQNDGMAIQAHDKRVCVHLRRTQATHCFNACSVFIMHIPTPNTCTKTTMKVYEFIIMQLWAQACRRREKKQPIPSRRAYGVFFTLDLDSFSAGVRLRIFFPFVFLCSPQIFILRKISVFAHTLTRILGKNLKIKKDVEKNRKT